LEPTLKPSYFYTEHYVNNSIYKRLPACPAIGELLLLYDQPLSIPLPSFGYCHLLSDHPSLNNIFNLQTFDV